MNLDATDQAILSLLQEDASLSHAEVGERAGVSAASAWRRIKRLEEDGVLRRRVALVDAGRAGLTVQVVVTVTLRSHGDGQREAFETWARNHPEVMSCYALTGDKDYVLHVVVKDMAAYDHFLTGDLLHREYVASASSSIVLREIKYTTALPIASAS
jgi:Lrp/AsnC family transcriptional regulator